jgi:hypothetical protein
MPGAVGLVTAINIQNDTPNDAVEQGHQFFNLLVSQAVDKFVKNRFVAAKMSGDPGKLSAPLTSEEIAQLQSGIASQVSQEIKDNISTWQKIGHFFSDIFGSGSEDSNVVTGTKLWPLVNTNIPRYFHYSAQLPILNATNTSFEITGEFVNLDAGGH